MDHLSNYVSRPPIGHEHKFVKEINQYHFDKEKVPKYEKVREIIEHAMLVIYDECPMSSDRTRAIQSLRDARMLANSAIALDGITLKED